MRACVGVCLREKGKVWVKRDSVCVMRKAVHVKQEEVLAGISPLKSSQVHENWYRLPGVISVHVALLWIRYIMTHPWYLQGINVEYLSNEGLTQKRKVLILAVIQSNHLLVKVLRRWKGSFVVTIIKRPLPSSGHIVLQHPNVFRLVQTAIFFRGLT